ncbi:UvrD-helicase domain-containing protein [Demequina litorisediminis]|uniref:DNA helicase n=1 Tax=Demequina litorisediminis TaxID=1849022 RepID=A0ABQ6IF69_9MICO|nr:UvrD-helicase domain-containing protein [Demequina litorisediminis]GMA36455.1 hypothetical protein GCM10025876_26590 [Demequina litorisediminis]
MSLIALVQPTRRGAAIVLDADQDAAVTSIVEGPGNVVVVGPPGSGKTSVVAAAAARAVAAGVRPDRLLVLAPTRAAAASLRDVVSAAVDKATGVPVVRTAASVAHAILAARAESEGEPPPSLITGADQDAILRDLLAGHARGEGSRPDWRDVVPDEATLLPGFRAELRDLIMRATEAGLDPEGLSDLAARTGRREWAAAAEVLGEYLDNVMWRTLLEGQGLRYDPAGVAREAAVALDTWEPAWGPAPEWDLVIVDDYQDATAAVIALVEAMAHVGARVALVGNADESVQGYRGAVPSALGEATKAAGRHAFDASLVRLTTNHRQPEALAKAVDDIVARIGTQSVGSARRPSSDLMPEHDGADAGASRRNSRGPSPVCAVACDRRGAQALEARARLGAGPVASHGGHRALQWSTAGAPRGPPVCGRAVRVARRRSRASRTGGHRAASWHDARRGWRA